MNLRFSIDVSPGNREVSVTLANERIFVANSGDTFVVPIKAPDVPPGDYPLTITAIDSNLKSSQHKITLTILSR